ncbi:TMV resistance protein N-like [Lotus japonicus]|uniref:TMV resistance protein N-like n=1 Tax=Lotus japonicus TaxID=34305 RepID=UPI002588F828|nr:TMV resistance protein N-like [Lotus japonicus]
MYCKQIQSSSSSQTIWKYDVFLSFRGEDTRNNFTDHLFGALYEKGFVIFKDDIKLTKGGDIFTELLQAIEESQILIVVFSKNYASSKWCLQELAKIADCINVQGQKVLPIFYDVNPSDVRRQSGNYEKAFAKHEERFKDHIEMIQTWREALSQVASLSGWDISNKDAYKSFDIDSICTIVEKFYPMDFSEQEKINLRFQLQHFITDARQESNLKNLSTIQELCSCLAATKKSEVYYLFDRLFRLIMTLPVSTATSERSFSAMKIIKTRLRNKMEADYLADSMIVHIERDIATSFSSDSLIDDFKSLKERRAAL